MRRARTVGVEAESVNGISSQTEADNDSPQVGVAQQVFVEMKRVMPGQTAGIANDGAAEILIRRTSALQRDIGGRCKKDSGGFAIAANFE